MDIAGHKVGSGQRPFVIAEISGNHCGSIERAKRLIKAAKYAGADAVKTQCYEADTLTLNINRPDFIIQEGLWRGRSLYELYGKACTPMGWHEELYNYAKAEKITIFSSVFDRSGVDLLEHLGCPCYKIASFEMVDTPLISYAAKTGKPLIISTGLACNNEIIEANIASGQKAAFLHCTSEYPGTIEHANLGRAKEIDLLLGFNNIIGISDHTLGYAIPIAATALGINIIEKHLKLTYGPESEDDPFSLTPEVFKTMTIAVKQIYEALQVRQTNGSSRQLRRSLYVVEDIEAGAEFTLYNVRSIRPGYGLPPKFLNQLIGQKAKKSFRRGDRLCKDDIP